VLAAAVIAAVVLIAVTGCSDLSSTLRSNLEHRADSVKTSFAEALSKHGSNEDVANSIRKVGLDGVLSIVTWKRSDYATGATAPASSSVWKVTTTHGQVQIDVLVSSTASQGGLDVKDLHGYACLQLSGSTKSPSKVVVANAKCTILITKVLFPAQYGNVRMTLY
jgi:hypothetical protein